MNDSDSRNRPVRRAHTVTLAAMSLGYAVVQLDVTIVNTALNAISRGLGGGIAELQWIVSTYTIAFAALILTAGALGDRIGAKRVFIAGFGIFTAASLVCALAPTMAILIAGRALQGLGAAILVPNSLALLNHAYPGERERGRAVSVWAAGASLMLTAGPLAGGVLIALIGWRSIFFVNLPIGLVGLALAWRYAEETTRSPRHELDLPGQVLAIGALGSLAAAMIEGGVRGWTNPWVIAGFALAVMLAGLFILRERRARQPMLPLRLFGQRMFSLMSLVGLLVNVAFYGLIFVLSLYFQQINGLSPFMTGLAFLPMLGVILPVNLLAPRAAERLGALTVIAGGAALAAAGCVALLVADRGTPYWAVSLQMIALGAGLAILVPPLTSALLGSVDKTRSGVAAAVLNSARQTGSVLGVSLFGSLLGRGSASVPGMHHALMISTALLLGTAAATLYAKRSAAAHPVRGG